MLPPEVARLAGLVEIARLGSARASAALVCSAIPRGQARHGAIVGASFARKLHTDWCRRVP